MRLNNLELKYYYDSKFEIVNFHTQKDEKEPIFEAILNAEKYINLKDETWNLLINKSTLAIQRIDLIQNIFSKYNKKLF